MQNTPDVKLKYIGTDNKGNKLSLGDICSFRINNEIKIGVITYSEDYFSYSFDMEDDNFPCVLMNKVDMDSIEKIDNIFKVAGTKQYTGLQKIWFK